MKKIVFVLLLLFSFLILALFSALNSSYVISKIADRYAPDYHISYEKISGNIFTGIEIENLHYANQRLAHTIVYKWNPLALLHKKISIRQIKIEDANIDLIQSLVKTFGTKDTNKSSSGSFDFDVEVDNIDLKPDAFIQNNIAVHKSLFRADNIHYRSDGSIDVGKLYIEIDSNLTQLKLKGSMKEQELIFEALELDALDTHMLEALLSAFSQENEAKTKEQDKEHQADSKKPFIPKRVRILSLKGSIVAREYKTVAVDNLDIAVNNADIDIRKIVQNQKNAIALGSLALKMDTNVTSIDMNLSIDQEDLIVHRLTLHHVDTEALEKIWQRENNETKKPDEEKKSTKEDTNIWIPKNIIIARLQTDFLAAKHRPVEIEHITIWGDNLSFDLENRVAKSGEIDLKGVSNLSDINLEAKVNAGILKGKLLIHPKRALFRELNLPLRAKAIERIEADINVSSKYIAADIYTKAKELLLKREDGFNIDIHGFTARLDYDIAHKRLEVKSKALVDTPYASNIVLTNRLKQDDSFSYEGEIKADTLNGLESYIIEPLRNLDITYKGDAKSIDAKLLSKQLKGSFYTKEMKRGRLRLETLEPLYLNEFAPLPKELNGSKMDIKIDFPINFEKKGELEGKIKVTSNLLNMHADVTYAKTLRITSKTEIPPQSLLRKFNRKIKWQNLSPLSIDLTMKKSKLSANLRSRVLHGDINYHLQQHAIEGKIDLAGLHTTISGNSDKTMSVKSRIDSIVKLQKGIAALYRVDAPVPLDGSAVLTASIDKKEGVDILLSSPKLLYQADAGTKHLIRDIEAKLSLRDTKIILERYRFHWDKQKFFATKPSVVRIKENVVNLESLWVNDALSFTGEYHMQSKQGRIDAKAESFPVIHDFANLKTKIDLSVAVDGNSTNIEGKLELLEGKITYDVNQKSFASDSDIIIVQERKREKQSPWMQNMSVNVQVVTKKPLKMKQGAIDIELKPELGIHKAKNEKLMLLGSVLLPKGGTYSFERKKFILEKSAVHFTGNPNKPLLEIKVKHRSLNHKISIFISGTPAAPQIQFSSKPSLKKEQILSLILFDTEAGGDVHSGDEMMKMMGGAMAKSALNDIGVKIDHLVLGEGNSIEVGKQLTDKITIIYVDGEVSQVKLKYRHSPRTESVLQMSEESQSYDIIFKDDF